MKKLILIFFFISVNLSAIELSDVLENAIQAVVTVSVKQKSEERRVFGFASNMTNPYNKKLDMSDSKIAGSGFVITYKDKLYIITNAHVVQYADENASNSLSVYSVSGKEFKVRIVGGDTFYDIAILEFVDNPEDEVKSLTFSEDKLRIGQSVYAIGNPLGAFPYSVSDGIISGLNRFFDESITDKYGYIQTSAGIASGNSGGPLINSKGEVVGMNTLTYSEFQHLNFSLDKSILKKSIESIIDKGRVIRNYLGLIISQDYKKIEESEYIFYNKVYFEKIDERPVISNIIPNSPAEKLFRSKVGAEIVEINGQNIHTISDVISILEESKPNSDITFTFDINGNIEILIIKSVEMDALKLRNIASFFFKEYLNADLLEKDGNVILKNNNFSKKSEKRILNLGYGKDLWKIKSITDLSVTLRLSLLQGGFNYGFKNDQDLQNEAEFWFSDDEYVARKTIIY